ncbi:MAG: hypothetical protein QOF89_3465 [Acidobacteriota bacterium]|jgi:hypothetical protein|nr:hypothetical protein [Acidobacteriota bacterium]
MTKNLDRFKKDLDALVDFGRTLEMAMDYECFPEAVHESLKKQIGKKADEYIKSLPSFGRKYQRWYSEALGLLRQLLPERVADFSRHYEKPKARKEITFENYRIEDYLQGLNITRGGYEKVVGPDAALPQFRQQLAIVEAAASRFESSLFEIRQLVQADLLDSEIEAAEELARYKFARAAGALAGVVLERHLAQVSEDHQLSIGKKNPTIADFNEKLKTSGVIDLPQWRFIQHLADIRNLCDHSRKPEPTAEQVADLIAGVKKVKTVY